MQIGKSDLDRKMKQAQGFLAKKQQVRVVVKLSGRQKANPERAVEFLNEISRTYFTEGASPANKPSISNLSITFNPKS